MNKTQCQSECESLNGYLIPEVVENLNETESFNNLSVYTRAEWKKSRIVNYPGFNILIDGHYDFKDSIWRYGTSKPIPEADWLKKPFWVFPKYPFMKDLVTLNIECISCQQSKFD